MAEWIEGSTGLSFNPVYYMCSINDPVHGELNISLRPPYESDSWSWRLTKNQTTVFKDTFRFRSRVRDDEHPETWESIDDLEKAKAMAVRLAMRHVARQADYWETMHRALSALQPHGKEQDNGKKKQKKN